MPPTRANQPKGPKFLDAKVSIAALSIAVTAGLWNLFANSAMAAEKAGPAPDEGQTAPPVVESQASEAGLLPLPTLVPLVKVTSPDAGAAAPASQPAQNGAAPALRSVSAPTAVIVQKQRPLIDQPSVQVSDGGDRGNGGGSAPAPVTTTRSSR